MDVTSNIDRKCNASEIDRFCSDDSNKVIAPVRENRNFDNNICHGGIGKTIPTGNTFFSAANIYPIYKTSSKIGSTSPKTCQQIRRPINLTKR